MVIMAQILSPHAFQCKIQEEFSETNFSETNLKFYPLFYNHNIIIFISLRLKVLDFNISAFLFKIQLHV